MAGCGGGSAPTGSTAPHTISGVAATGAPITGTVYLKDAATREVSQTIAPDGSYSFDVTNLTAPFMLKATGTANGQSVTLYSEASGPGITNINPFSHLVLAQFDPAGAYDSATVSSMQNWGAAFNGALPALKTALQPVLSSYGVASVDFVHAPFTANHQGLDLLFDTVAITYGNNSLTMTDKSTGAVILSTPLSTSVSNWQFNMANVPRIGMQPMGTVFLYPVSTSVIAGGSVQFRGIIKGMTTPTVTWSVVEAGGGYINSSGLYTAPIVAGTYHVIATNPADPAQSSTATVRVIAKNYVNLQSDAGDYIGGGQNYSYTSSNAIITVTGSGGLLSVTVTGQQSWRGNFQESSSFSQLHTGTYSDVHRYPFYTPGLDWSGEGRGSNVLTGSFTIDRAVYVNGALTEVDANFEQHSEGAQPALRGQIHWTNLDTSTAPGPITPVPAELWQAASGATPATGNYIYLESEPGDYIGAGKAYTYTDTQVAVSAAGGHLSVNTVNSPDSWWGDFQTMNSITQLQPGYYDNLQRYPFNNPVEGGLSWSGNGRGCNTLTGWFVADNVTYSAGVLTSIDLRFEQHCEGGTPALHGQIHWAK